MRCGKGERREAAAFLGYSRGSHSYDVQPRKPTQIVKIGHLHEAHHRPSQEKTCGSMPSGER